MKIDVFFFLIFWVLVWGKDHGPERGVDFYKMRNITWTAIRLCGHHPLCFIYSSTLERITIA
jgi:hypothetical protein